MFYTILLVVLSALIVQTGLGHPLIVLDFTPAQLPDGELSIEVGQSAPQDDLAIEESLSKIDAQNDLDLLADRVDEGSERDATNNIDQSKSSNREARTIGRGDIGLMQGDLGSGSSARNFWMTSSALSV